MQSWWRLFLQRAALPRSFADDNAGRSKAAKIPMMAITTMSSIKVNAGGKLERAGLRLVSALFLLTIIGFLKIPVHLGENLMFHLFEISPRSMSVFEKNIAATGILAGKVAGSIHRKTFDVSIISTLADGRIHS